MSGSGRKSQYRKGLTSEFLDKHTNYVPVGDELIARVLANRGANLFEIKLPTSSGLDASSLNVLAKLPKKFNKLIWIKTGDYVIVEKYIELSIKTKSVTQTKSKKDVKSETVNKKKDVNSETLAAVAVEQQSTSSVFTSIDNNTVNIAYTIKHIPGKDNLKFLKSSPGIWPEEFKLQEEEEPVLTLQLAPRPLDTC
jgi:translation initiation factor IF-1